MPKKKPKQSSQVLSPEKYIKTKARSLSIGECLIRNQWQERGMGEIIIPRIHKSGNVTVGIFLLDTFCLGLKNSMYNFNMLPEDYEELLATIFSQDDYAVISYQEAHNLIYGAIEYAEDLGFQPEKTYAVTQYILEEDAEEIPLIEYEYGKDGMPFLITSTRLEASKYIPTLEKSVGIGNFDVYIIEEDEDYPDDLDFNNDFTQTEYTYKYPDYPQSLSLHHIELEDLFSHEYMHSLPKEKIDLFLSLPYNTLVADLEQIILVEIGKFIHLTEQDTLEEIMHSAVTHCLFLLGELKAEKSLNTVLEVMRQNEAFIDFHFGDADFEILPLTLYYTGGNQLPALFEYVKETGLYPFVRTYVFTAMGFIAINESKRRDEVIEWFRKVLLFYTENAYNPEVYDGNLAGMLIEELTDMKAKKLLPEIKLLFDTGQVNERSVGDYETTFEEINSDNSPSFDYKPLTIYERYEEYQKIWEDHDMCSSEDTKD